MSDDTLYLYTSLTAGSSHIITATSRMETILKANKIPFKAIDCATDDKARMLWGRRSKGRKLPGLVKYGDVIADYEQVEEWNEYGELQDQIEEVDDIFGDVPISATTAEAQAAAAARVSAANSASNPPRESSETRHISINDPKDKDKDKSKATSPESALKKDASPLALAMRQAGAEAAAIAGQQKKTGSIAAAKPPAKDATEKDTPAPASASESKLAPDMQDPTPENTDAKSPEKLAAEGSMRTESLDKVTSPPPESESEDGTKSTEEQVLDQQRRASIPTHKSSLSKETSIDDVTNRLSGELSRRSSTYDERPRQHRGSDVEAADPEVIRLIEQAAAIQEEDEEDEDEAEAEDDSDSEEDKKDEKKATPVTKSAAKVTATDEIEKKATDGKKPQDQDAKDVKATSVSVGD